MAMNIHIKGEGEGNTYLITMGKDKITATCPTRLYPWAEQSQSEAKEWISNVLKIHRNRNKKQPLVVGLCAIRKVDHSDAEAQMFLKPKHVKWYKQNAPYDLIILCVGEQCLLWEIDMQPKDSFRRNKGFKPYEIPKFLKDFLSSDRTIVVGLGIDTVLKKLQSDTDLLISKQVEIRDFMQEKFGDPKFSSEFAKLNLGKLSKTLLGPEREVVKPRHILWNNGVGDGGFSDDLITYGSIEAFLVAKMYSELCDPQSAENLKTKRNVALNERLVT